MITKKPKHSIGNVPLPVYPAIKNLGGRPTKYTAELGERICQALENSARGLRWLCANYEDFPIAETVREWVRTGVHGDFTQRYLEARRNQAHFISDEIVDVTYDAEPDKFGRVEKNKLMLDALKWKAKVLQPKVYGDKLIDDAKSDKDTTAVVMIPFNNRGKNK